MATMATVTLTLMETWSLHFTDGDVAKKQWQLLTEEDKGIFTRQWLTDNLTRTRAHIYAISSILESQQQQQQQQAQ